MGMMGSGKSTVGPLVAARLGMDWVDLDGLVETMTGSSVADIWRAWGEEKFRELELEALASLGARRAVVGCGGGIVLREDARRLLSEMGRCVYLRASPRELARRLTASGTRALASRPLLEGAASESEMVELLGAILEGREALYREVADFVVDTEGCSPEEVAESVVAWLGQS